MSDTRPSTIVRSRQSTASSRAPFAARSTTRRRSGKVVSGRPSPLASRATISAVSRSEVLASSSLSARGRARHRSAPRADTVRPASASRTASHSSTYLALASSASRLFTNDPHCQTKRSILRPHGLDDGRDPGGPCRDRSLTLGRPGAEGVPAARRGGLTRNQIAGQDPHALLLGRSGDRAPAPPVKETPEPADPAAVLPIAARPPRRRTD